MSTVTRNLSNIDGVNVPPPTQTGFVSNQLPAYPNDAAFEAVHTPEAGSIYWNTTEHCLREYNGTSWQYDKTILAMQVDSTTTGTAQTVTASLTEQAIRFTQGSLTQIIGITAPPAGNQKHLYLINDQAAQSITIANQAAGATAANRIITGLNADMSLQPGRTATLIYDEDVSRWRVTSAQAVPSGGIEVFTSDAAYEASHPAPGIGAIYWNSTIRSLREYNGTSWQHDKLQVDTQTDAATTGANQDITPSNNQIIRFTQGSLSSIRGIIPGIQTFVFLVNDQASQTISIQNQAAGATAANRIITGTGADFSLAAGKIVGLSYDSGASRWRISGGGAGGGLQPILVSSGPVSGAAGFHYLTDTTAAPFTLNLPAGTSGATIRITDATETWALNNLTVVPFTGQKIDMLAIDETLVCDVVRGWVELNWTGTYWAFNSLASTQVGEASATAAGIVSTGTQSFAGNKTFLGSITPTGGLGGKVDGLAALSPNIGQVIRASQAVNANMPATGTTGDGLSIPLTVGIFRIDCSLWVLRNGATVGAPIINLGVSTTPGNSNAGLAQGINLVWLEGISTTFNQMTITPLSFTVSCDGSTITRIDDNVAFAAGLTLYQKLYMENFSVATPQYRGKLTATRIG